MSCIYNNIKWLNKITLHISKNNQKNWPKICNLQIFHWLKSFTHHLWQIIKSVVKNFLYLFLLGMCMCVYVCYACNIELPQNMVVSLWYASGMNFIKSLWMNEERTENRSKTKVKSQTKKWLQRDKHLKIKGQTMCFWHSLCKYVDSSSSWSPSLSLCVRFCGSLKTIHFRTSLNKRESVRNSVFE